MQYDCKQGCLIYGNHSGLHNPETNKKESGQAPWHAPTAGEPQPPAETVAGSQGGDIFSLSFWFPPCL